MQDLGHGYVFERHGNTQGVVFPKEQGIMNGRRVHKQACLSFFYLLIKERLLWYTITLKLSLKMVWGPSL